MFPEQTGPPLLWSALPWLDKSGQGYQKIYFFALYFHFHLMRRMLTERTVSVMTVKIKSSLTLTAALMCFHERLVSWFWVLQYSGLVLSRFSIAVSVTKFCTTREWSETWIRCWRAETSRGLWLDPVWLGSARQGLASPSQRGLPAWMGVHPGVWQSISPSGVSETRIRCSHV